MPTMYELTNDYQALLDAAEDVDSDLLADTLESIHGAIETKAMGYASVIKELEYDAENLSKEIKRLSDRKAVFENNAKRIKQRLQRQMELIGMNKVKGKRFTVSIRNNAPHAVITDENKLPAYLLRVIREPDKKAILTALKSSKEVPGAELEQSKSLQIR